MSEHSEERSETESLSGVVVFSAETERAEKLNPEQTVVHEAPRMPFRQTTTHSFIVVTLSRSKYILTDSFLLLLTLSIP